MDNEQSGVSLGYSKQAIEDVFCELIEERTIQFSESDQNLKIHQQLKGYIMALEDAYYRLYGKEFDYGQDSEPSESYVAQEAPF
jgi:hypothetical protein